MTITITKRQNWVTLCCLTINWTHDILHYCKTFTFKQKDKTFTFKQRYEKQRTEIWKDKKRKKKKTKAVARRRLRERTVSLKEEKEECKGQVLNTHTHTQKTKAVARRRLRERTVSLKGEKEECKGQVLNTHARARAQREREREREREIVSARLQLYGHVGDLVVQHINKVLDFLIFLLCKSNP